uniref:Uncharacterized protein n=1 Tax=Caenorhabditis japonica TaxID=281687 RepID=A0A8R1ESV1_CAEJA
MLLWALQPALNGNNPHSEEHGSHVGQFE